MDITLLIVICYFLMIFGISFIFRFIKDRDNHNKELTIFPLTVSIIMTLFGGGFILGGAELGYIYGWQGLVYGFSSAIGLLFLGLILGKRIYLSGKKLGVNTLSNFLYKKFNSKSIYLYSSLMSVTALVAIAAAQLFAATRIFSAMGLPTRISLFFLVIIVLLIASNGLNSLSSFGKYNLIIASVGIIATLFIQPEKSVEIINPTTDNPINFILIASIFLPTLFYSLVGQDIYQKFYYAKNVKSIKTATVIASLVLFLLSFFPVLIGIKARTFLKIMPSEAVPQFIIFSMPSIFKGLFIAAILAAVIGCAQSILNAAANQFSEDISSYLKIRDKQKIFLVTVSIMVLLSFVMAVISNKIIDNLIIAYSLYISGMILPVFFAFFIKNPSRHLNTIFISSLFAFLISVVMELKLIRTNLPSVVWSVSLGIISFFIITLIKIVLKRDNKRKIYKQPEVNN